MSTEPKALEVERYDEDGTPHFGYWTDDDCELYFLWNAVQGDPIQVISGDYGVVIDQIPTDNFPMMDSGNDLDTFKAWSETYVAQYKNKQAMEETSDDKPVANNGPTISGGNVTIKWVDEAGRVLASGTVFQDTGPITEAEKAYFREKEPEEPQTEDPNSMLERLLTPHEPPR